MHTMSRMRNASDFYPRLNVRKLFRLVTMESFGLEHINPTLLQLAAEVRVNGKVEGNEWLDGRDIYSSGERVL